VWLANATHTQSKDLRFRPSRSELSLPSVHGSPATIVWRALFLVIVFTMSIFQFFRRVAALLCLSAALPCLAQHPQALFYMTETPDSVRDFLAHASQVDLLVPTWYTVDQNGLVSGEPDPLVMQTAKTAHVPVEPLLASQFADPASFHHLLNDPPAQQQMIAALLREARLHAYEGFQFDFENVAWTDRDAVSALVTRAGAALHAAGLRLSIAVVPAAPGYPGATAFSTWNYAHWQGAYDLAALAKVSDLICLMTYDEHTAYTPPGPVAGWHWVIENLDDTLQSVPKTRLSLGIPLYGRHWYAGPPKPSLPNPTAPWSAAASHNDLPNITADYISGEDALLLARTWGATVQWDPVDRNSWFWFYRDNVREWVFFTTGQSFAARYDLVKHRGLEGFCSWVLGTEDPSIWKVLPTHP
jgi:spore germination protein YaaH